LTPSKTKRPKQPWLSQDPAIWQPHPDILKLSRRKDVALSYSPRFRRIAVRAVQEVHKAQRQSAWIMFTHCPFTGRRLPGDLTSQHYTLVKRLFGEDALWDETYPKEFHTDIWWRERRISLRTGRDYHIYQITKQLAWVKETGYRLTWRDEEDDLDDHLPVGYRRGPYQPPHLCYRLSEMLSSYDAMFWYVPWDREYGPRILDMNQMVVSQPIKVAAVPYCPCCGKKLPPSLKALRLQRLEALGLSPDDPDLPETWRTDQWWREEGQWPDKPPKDGTR